MKYKIKRRRKTIKTRYIFIALVIGLILISISYAQNSTRLTLNGSVTGELMQYSVAYLNFENYASYPVQVPYKNTYTCTFTGAPILESIMMGGVELILNTDYTYSNGTLTIPNVMGNLVIEAEDTVVHQDYWITYVFGSESFYEYYYINTDIPLFSTANKTRDFEISINVSNFTVLDGQDTKRNVLLCNQNEEGEPYQGFAFQYRDGAIKTQANCTKVAEVQKPWGKTSGDVVFSRINDALYQDGNLLYNFANRITAFDAPLSIGANLDVNGNPRRFCTADISNIQIKLKYTHEEYQTICQNLPTPEKPGSRFAGWFTALNGGTQVTSLSDLEANNGIIYVHWQAAPTVSITFNSNGGTGTMNKQTIEADLTTNLNPNLFTRTDYNFIGWNTKQDGTGTTYADGGPIKLTQNMTLYAIWMAPERTSYAYSGSVTFDGSVPKVIDTGVRLFSAENIHKNFEMYFEVVSLGSNTNQATLMNTKDEYGGTPWPGIVFRVDQNKLMLKGDSKSGSSKRDDRALNAVQKVRIIRINDTTYYSINDESYQTLMDFTNIVRTFDTPVSFGGVLKPTGTRERRFKGTLANMSVGFISDSATLADYENALPS